MPSRATPRPKSCPIRRQKESNRISGFTGVRRDVTLFFRMSVDSREPSIYSITRSRRQRLAATGHRTTKSLEPTRTFRGSTLKKVRIFVSMTAKTGLLKVK